MAYRWEHYYNSGFYPQTPASKGHPHALYPPQHRRHASLQSRRRTLGTAHPERHIIRRLSRTTPRAPVAQYLARYRTSGVLHADDAAARGQPTGQRIHAAQQRARRTHRHHPPERRNQQRARPCPHPARRHGSRIQKQQRQSHSHPRQQPRRFTRHLQYCLCRNPPHEGRASQHPRVCRC